MHIFTKKMRHYRPYFIVLISFNLSFQLLTSGLISHNLLYLFANKLYTATSINQITKVKQVGAMAQIISACPVDKIIDGSASIIYHFDDCYLHHSLPLHIVSDQIELSANDLAAGSSRTDQTQGDTTTLFGGGYLQSRLFFLYEEPTLWSIAVRGKHDAPTPVMLELWVDEKLIDTFVFDKGDDTWETLSLTAFVTPGFHNVYLRYVNDFFDPIRQLDRNAYIESMRVMR